VTIAEAVEKLDESGEETHRDKFGFGHEISRMIDAPLRIGGGLREYATAVQQRIMRRCRAVGSVENLEIS